MRARLRTRGQITDRPGRAGHIHHLRTRQRRGEARAVSAHSADSASEIARVKISAAPRDGTPSDLLSGSVFRRAWRTARETIPTPEEYESPLASRVYDLRHSCLTTWLNIGVPPAQVAEWVATACRSCSLHTPAASPISSGPPGPDRGRRQPDRPGTRADPGRGNSPRILRSHPRKHSDSRTAPDRSQTTPGRPFAYVPAMPIQFS